MRNPIISSSFIGFYGQRGLFLAKNAKSDKKWSDFHFRDENARNFVDFVSWDFVRNSLVYRGQKGWYVFVYNRPWNLSFGRFLYQKRPFFIRIFEIPMFCEKCLKMNHFSAFFGKTSIFPEKSLVFEEFCKNLRFFRKMLVMDEICRKKLIFFGSFAKIRIFSTSSSFFYEIYKNYAVKRKFNEFFEKNTDFVIKISDKVVKMHGCNVNQCEYRWDRISLIAEPSFYAISDNIWTFSYIFHIFGYNDHICLMSRDYWLISTSFVIFW